MNNPYESNYKYEYDNDDFNGSIDHKQQKIKDLEIKNSELQAQLINVYSDQRNEEILRENNPTLMDAWKKYLVVKKLVKDKEELND